MRHSKSYKSYRSTVSSNHRSEYRRYNYDDISTSEFTTKFDLNDYKNDNQVLLDGGVRGIGFPEWIDTTL